MWQQEDAAVVMNCTPCCQLDEKITESSFILVPMWFEYKWRSHESIGYLKLRLGYVQGCKSWFPRILDVYLAVRLCFISRQSWRIYSSPICTFTSNGWKFNTRLDQSTHHRKGPCSRKLGNYSLSHVLHCKFTCLSAKVIKLREGGSLLSKLIS